ncbi:CRISPR-associated helicase/endonuclease Cas3 [Zobellella denitrificans]|uniref:CRISPR-associated helicase/endonuclease Cas3 n=1 Tax=Zobellella denitrificans TaxID=347534 RepID=UPI000B8C668F|nr:CRISPR-associated helicase/endonuclease Cas3 [Zobellella denitrificans]OXS14527.1 CRISPR-associated helicase/endonuclease Cas3 [Zobellella denitrificans]
MSASYFQYWGKARKDDQQPGADYHLLPYHCLDVAAVGWWLLDNDKPLARNLADFLNISPGQLRLIFTFSLMLHDLGKFASAFQHLAEFTGSSLVRHQPKAGYDSRQARHDRLGYFFWLQASRGRHLTGADIGLKQTDLARVNPALDSLNTLFDVVFGHHGYPIDWGSQPKMMKDYCHESDIDAACEFIRDCAALLDVEWPEQNMADREWLARLRQISWHLSGLAILSDWIGSDTTFFEYQAGGYTLTEYWLQAKNKAQRALAATELTKPVKVQPFASVQTHFGFSPTPLQAWAESVPLASGPQLFILEDVTGAGKTEAALTLTHRLLQQGEADGFYFGLPTMATSNAMFSRVAGHYRQMLSVDGGCPSIVLAHGAREMNELFREALTPTETVDTAYVEGDDTASLYCNHWLADSRKKALLATVGVGTIDQALMAVLPRKHQPLRLLGLHRKILIFDEVHAADTFMFELLDDLLRVHLRQGGSAILLTATLAQRQRERLCRIWQQAAGVTPMLLPEKNDFPLATRVSIEWGLEETPVATRAAVSRELAVVFVHSEQDCVARILAARKRGDCVVWLRNSVDDAIRAYQMLATQLGSAEALTLFHSRFTLKDRKTIEDKVLSIFGKQGGQAERLGQVLIATQVFQESLDADADLMISDLCPIDDLIQRAGRLHRHIRDQAGNRTDKAQDERPAPMLLVHAPEWQEQPDADWLLSQLPNTEHVYRSPGRLWLGMQVLRRLGAIRMPGEARALIEAVYGEEALERMPETLKKKEDQYFGEMRGQAAQAKSQLIEWSKGYNQTSARAWHDDNIEISTRYVDRETVQVLVLKLDPQGRLQLWAEGKPYALQNSIVKLAKQRFADKLTPLPSQLAAAFDAISQRYRQAKFLQPWLPEQDSQFGYSTELGVFETNKEVT